MRLLLIAHALTSMAAAIACVGPADRALRPCPCAQGYQCCTRIERCVREDEVAHLACDPPETNEPPDSGTADAFDVAGADASPPHEDSSGCRSGGGGVMAAYYPSGDFTGIPATRHERGLSHSWGVESPDPSIGEDHFTAKFSAQLQPDVTDMYTFFAGSDDGVRLWLDGELLLDWWRAQTYTAVGSTVGLQAGRTYALLVEYLEKTGNASLDVTWRRRGMGASTIPQCALREAAFESSGCRADLADDCVPDGTPPCVRAGTGLTGEYYSDPSFGNRVFARIDPSVSFAWGWQTPDPVTLRQAFSVRWEGFLEVPYSETYTFFLVADGIAELRIAGQSPPSLGDGVREEVTLAVALTAGESVPIRVDYVQPNVPAHSFIQLRWKSRSIPKGSIPRCRFSP